MNSGLVAGTRVHTDNGLVAIENIKIGDKVLASPNHGRGEPVYKPVTNTFSHSDKEIWVIELKRYWNNSKMDNDSEYIDEEIFERTLNRKDCLLVTANHPLCIVGEGLLGDERDDFAEDINYYDVAQWKTVADTNRLDIMIGKDGIRYFINRIQPLCKLKCAQQTEYNPDVAWYQDEYRFVGLIDTYDDFIKNIDKHRIWGAEIGVYEEILHEDGINAETYAPEDLKDFSIGYTFDLAMAKDMGTRFGRMSGLEGKCYHIVNELKDQAGNYIPYTADVYNIEVADHHNYFIGESAVLVGRRSF